MPATDPSSPDFWNERYLSGKTPWDFGGIPSDAVAFLQRRLKAGSGSPGRALIPGCGTGYEIRAFAEAGFEVTAIDVSAAAVEKARRTAGPDLAGRVQEADFFTADLAPGSFDLIYERTFLCALVPERRELYTRRVARLLKPGGAFVGYFFYKRTAPEDGPPYGLAWGESDELFARYFLLTKDLPVSDSLPVFAGRERWQEQRRTSYSD